MKNENLFRIWLGIAFLAIAYYFIYKRVNRKRYFDYLNDLGFGSYWLDKMNDKEIKTFYTYIHDYTQKGLMPTVGTSLDLALVNLALKYPQLNINYK